VRLASDPCESGRGEAYWQDSDSSCVDALFFVRALAGPARSETRDGLGATIAVTMVQACVPMTKLIAKCPQLAIARRMLVPGIPSIESALACSCSISQIATGFVLIRVRALPDF